MQVLLFHDTQPPDGCSLELLLRQWLEQTGRLDWQVSSQVLPLEAVLTSAPDVLVLSGIETWPLRSLEGLLSGGAGAVIATRAEGLDRLQQLAEMYPVHLIPDRPTGESLGLAVASALGARRRRLRWEVRLQQLEQRLDDRVLIERAKEILARRLNLPEEEAYKLMRLRARQQRRQIRDLARAVVDVHDILPVTGGDSPVTAANLAVDTSIP